MAVLSTGPAGLDMRVAHYMPWGGPLETLVSSLPTSVVVSVPSIGETFTFNGAFNGAGTVGGILGTINSITVTGPSATLVYSLTGLSIPFSSYLSFATVQDFVGFEKQVLPVGSSVLGGSGNDAMFWLAGNHTYQGGGGIDTLDYSQVPYTGTTFTHTVIFDVLNGIATVNDRNTNLQFPKPPLSTDSFSGIETFIGSALGRTNFAGGPGSHTFIGGAGGAILSYNSPGAVTINLQTNIVQNGYGGIDTIQNIPWYFSSAPSTTFVGGNGSFSFTSTANVTYDYSAMSGAITVTGSGFGWAVLKSNGGVDTITDNQPNTQIIGTAFADTFTPESSYSALNGVTYNGGGGVDTLDYMDYPLSGGVPKTVDLVAGTGLWLHPVSGAVLRTDLLISIENVIGSPAGDNLTGNADNNVLRGAGGNDTLTGGGGSDSIVGGDNDDIIFATHDDGNDTITGGNGFDILDFSQVNGVVQINQLAGTITGSAGNDVLADVIEQIKGTAFNDVLSGGHGINVLDGEGGDDRFFGNNGDDLMRGGTGDDTFFFSTSDGNDTLFGGDGFDVLDYSSLLGVVQVNQLAGTTTGTANNDTLTDIFEMVIGTAFGDVLSGGHGINSLKGNGGDDQIFANNGDDYTSGGDGNDTITMGVGNDTHDFRNGEDIDTILDFTAGGTDDTITLKFYTGLGSSSFDAAFQARLSTVSGHAELTLNGGDKIIFNNVSSHTSLTAADFIF